MPWIRPASTRFSRAVAIGSLDDFCDTSPIGLPHPVGVAQDVDTGDGRVAGVRPGQRGEDLDGAGLAGAVRAEQREHRPRRDVDRQAVEGADRRLASPARVGLDEIDGRQCRRRERRHGTPRVVWESRPLRLSCECASGRDRMRSRLGCLAPGPVFAAPARGSCESGGRRRLHRDGLLSQVPHRVGARSSPKETPSPRSSCIRRHAVVPPKSLAADPPGERGDEVQLGHQDRPPVAGSRRRTARAARAPSASACPASMARSSMRSRSARPSRSRATSSGSSSGISDRPGLQRGEVAHRHRQQLGQPVLALGDPGLGDLVDRPLGSPALPASSPARGSGRASAATRPRSTATRS